MITVHTLVKNEERYLWFAVTSVIDYVDKMLLWDTGSTDRTIQLIKELKKRYPQKIDTALLGNVDANEYTFARQEMLNKTKTEWVMILDGDEVWWQEKIQESVRVINANKELETVVSSYINPIGDIYHYQDPQASKYEIDGVTGPITIRLMNKKNIKGLYTSKPHGKHGYFDSDNKLIQERPKSNRHWTEGVSFLHFTNMIRSENLAKDRSVPKRDFKYKYELGKQFSLDFYYPESFFREKPKWIPDPWVRMSKDYYFKSLFETPLKKIKRKLIQSPSGY